MKNQLIGYIRVSSIDQNIDRQLEGIHTDKKFIDMVSGKNTDRPELQELIAYARDGDTVIVHSLNRLGRNLVDLTQLVATFTRKNIKVQFVKENLTFAGDDSPMSTLLFSMLGAFSEFERALIRERQKEGIALAKKRSAYKGRKNALQHDQIMLIQARIANGDKKMHIARDFSISRVTLDKYLAKIIPLETPPLAP